MMLRTNRLKSALAGAFALAVGGLTAMFVLAPPAVGQALRSDLALQYRDRAEQVIDFYADQIPADDYTRGGLIQVAANLYRGQNFDWAFARLDSLMAAPRGDMFWMYPFTTVYFAGREHIPDDVRAKMRDIWRTYQPYRGDTENHWALYYATLYLMAEEYPNDPGETWYNGKSSLENRVEARDYLISWMDLATTIGQGEYDSPHYLKVYIAPMALLYAYAQDPEMQKRAEMMLEYIIADYAVESLNSYYTGAHSRLYEREIVAPWNRPATAFGWLLFGNTERAISGESFILAVSQFRPPDILHAIATDRSEPYEHRELKRTRHRMRNSDIKNAPVYKYMWMRPEYALGSSQGGLLQPIQQQTWGLIWAVDEPVDKHNTLFTVQPHSSPHELQMYFAEHAGFITEIVVRSKTEYDSPDKWSGGSPYEQVVQHEDALIALYNTPEGARFEHMNGFLSRDLEDFTEDASGWLFMRGGDALIAVYPLAPYEILDAPGGDSRLYSAARQNGVVVQVAPAGDYASFDAFKEAVRALALTTATVPTPRVSFTTLGGDTIETTYGEGYALNGTPVDYSTWKLFDGPFLQAEKGSKKLLMSYGSWHRELDFESLTTTEYVQ